MEIHIMKVPPKITEIMENETTNIRKLKKQQLIILNHHFGFIQKKTIDRNILVENLIPIHRKMVLYKKILLEKEDCPICFISLNKWNHMITTCGHAFCSECIFKYITTEKECCPLCREPYTYEELIKPFTPKELESILSVIHTEKEKEQKEQTIPRNNTNTNTPWYKRLKGVLLCIVCAKIYCSLFWISVSLLHFFRHKSTFEVFIYVNQSDDVCYDYLLSEI